MFGILRLIGFASAAGFSILEELRNSYGWELNSVSAIPEGKMRDMFNKNALYLPFLGPVMPLLYYIGIGMMEDLAALPDQQLDQKNFLTGSGGEAGCKGPAFCYLRLSKFRVQDAGCFCCANGHRHPDTGKDEVGRRESVVMGTVSGSNRSKRRIVW